jgi:hypothetical protein
MYNKKNSFMFYPEITDSDFNEKIYLKKEFRDTEIKEKKQEYKKIEPKKVEFMLEAHQIFLKNFISPDTPYNGILIFHGTGVGKTCSAISIAEGFKKTLKNINKKVLILTSIKANFLKEIYNFQEELYKMHPEDVVQCTGKEYELGEEGLYMTYEQKKKEISKLIKSYYQFFGYRSFPNYFIENAGGWNGDENSINEKVKAFISNEFDNRVIVIDEIQNIKTDKKEELKKSIQPILQAIIKYGKNIKLILMSATPMFDRPDEIIYYINLLLQNDGRPTINKNDYFNQKDGTLKEGSEEKLRAIFTGYISYVRAEKPNTFPFRIYPKNSTIPNINYYMNGKKIESNKKLRFTNIILCNMKGIQANTYEYYFEKKIKEGKIENIIEQEYNIDVNNINNESEKTDMRILSDLTNISNICYPVLNENIGSFSKSSIDIDFDNSNGGFYKTSISNSSKKKIYKYKYQSHAIFDKDTINEAPFIDEKHLSKYSTKFSNILNTIKKSKGLILIYSLFIERGILPLALMLEQNGFTRECSDGEYQLLDYPKNKLKAGGKRNQICYLCGHDQFYKEHYEKSENYHIFKPAKYMLYFAEKKDIVKIKKDEALDKFCNRRNKYGEEVKIFMGTRAISEGLDFKMLRQVHILEPWYNLSRNEQIIGRAIRNKSHQSLPYEERNVEIFQYASILTNKKYSTRESVDLKNYRLAENKDITIKKIMKIMKECAVDCVLFKNTNVITDKTKVKQITSSGETLLIPIADKPYSAICNYEKECNYKCNWEPNPRLKYPINTDTYNLHFSSSDILRIKKHIKYMFRENIVYHLKTIEDTILNKFIDVDKLFIYSALEELTNNRNEIVYDKFSRKGYIIYRGDYYIFQPFDLDRDELPMIYRMIPSDIKPDSVDLETINFDYKNEEIINEHHNKENISNEINFIDKILLKIDITYNIHLKIAVENKKKYLEAVIGYVIDKLTLKEENIFYKNILIKYLQKSNDKYIGDIINYLNTNNKLINYYADISYDKNKIKDNIFVGYIVNKEYYIIDSVDKTKNIKTLKINKLNFIICSKDIVLKIKAYRNIINTNKNKKKSYNIIYGIIELVKNIKKFKIIDKSVEEEIFTKDKKQSKRSIITGRTCSTFQVGKLLLMRDSLGLYKIDFKYKIDFLCEDIEIFFRYKNLLDSKIWFVNI